MAHTFEELVEKQRTADAAHAQVEQLRRQYGSPSSRSWSGQQSQTYETAWRAWRDLARDVQAAVTAYAKEHGEARPDMETRVRKAAGHPE
ncbi:WXG100 family type VII secretion target [Streptomyces sp. NPDC051994]|uniref:WXG100 family type VII secretion target n=1 Tax=unclassified Streptomyces TaxID=2593676 RepID=UPI003415D955